jgi:hypothetical protein
MQAGNHLLRSTLAFQVPGVVLLAELNNPHYSFNFIGLETLNGAQVIHIKAVDDSDEIGSLVTPQEWYFDSSSYLPLRVVHRIPDLANPFSYVDGIIDYSAYTTMAGIFVPLRMSVVVDGSSPRTVQISSVQFNTGLSLGTFDVVGGGTQ